MASYHEFKLLIAAWIVLALIACFALSMIILLPLLPSLQPVLPYGINNPRYGAVPLDRSSDEMEERDQIEERKGWQRTR
jgi:hypothetical protein